MGPTWTNSLNHPGIKLSKSYKINPSHPLHESCISIKLDRIETRINIRDTSSFLIQYKRFILVWSKYIANLTISTWSAFNINPLNLVKI